MESNEGQEEVAETQKEDLFELVAKLLVVRTAHNPPVLYDDDCHPSSPAEPFNSENDLTLSPPQEPTVLCVYGIACVVLPVTGLCLFVILGRLLDGLNSAWGVYTRKTGISDNQTARFILTSRWQIRPLPTTCAYKLTASPSPNLESVWCSAAPWAYI